MTPAGDTLPLNAIRRAATVLTLGVIGLLLPACGSTANPAVTSTSDGLATGKPSPSPSVSSSPSEPTASPSLSPSAPPPPEPDPPPPPPPPEPPPEPPPAPDQGGAIASPVEIPDIYLITGSSWSGSEYPAEDYVVSKLNEACGALGPGCVDYEVVVDPDPRFGDKGVDCPVVAVRIPRPTYDGDVPETSYRDDLITIAIYDPCDGVIVATPPPTDESN